MKMPDSSGSAHLCGLVSILGVSFLACHSSPLSLSRAAAGPPLPAGARQHAISISIFLALLMQRTLRCVTNNKLPLAHIPIIHKTTRDVKLLPRKQRRSRNSSAANYVNCWHFNFKLAALVCKYNRLVLL